MFDDAKKDPDLLVDELLKYDSVGSESIVLVAVEVGMDRFGENVFDELDIIPYPKNTSGAWIDSSKFKEVFPKAWAAFSDNPL